MIWFGLAFAATVIFSIRVYFNEKKEYGGSPIFATVASLIIGMCGGWLIAFGLNTLFSIWVPSTVTISHPIEIVEFETDNIRQYVGTAVLKNDDDGDEVHRYWYTDGPEPEWTSSESSLVTIKETTGKPYVEYVYIDSNWPWLTIFGDMDSGEIVNVYVPKD